MKNKDKKQTRAYVITDDGVKVMITKEVNKHNRVILKSKDNSDDK